MEVVAVDAHVEDVEGAHRGPAVLVGEGQRDQAVVLSLLQQGLELIGRGRNRVVVLLEHALAVKDDPGVVVDGDEVLLAVVAGGSGLEGFAVVAANLIPHVADRDREALIGEEAHAETGKPREDVVRGGLQVRVQLVLERAVVDGVDAHGDASSVLAVGDRICHRCARDLIRVVRAKRRLALCGDADARERQRSRGKSGRSDRQAPGRAGFRERHVFLLLWLWTPNGPTETDMVQRDCGPVG